MKKYVVTAILLGFLANSAFAEDGHDHNGHKHHESHNHGKDDSHDEHEDHSDHDDHKGHDHSAHDEDEHEEGVVEIDDEAAAKAGIKTSIASSQDITKELSFNGKVTFDRNRYAEVKGRFDGIVTNAKANWGDRVSKGDVLAIIEANESLRSYSVKAPISGKVIERHTNVGDVTGDEALFKIADVSKMWVEFHIFMSDVKHIKQGQLVHVKLPDNDQEIEAPIKMILPAADEQSQTIVAIVEIDNKSNNWRPGMIVEGIIETGTSKADIAVHKDAIQRTPEGLVIYVKEEQKYEQRHIKTGQENSHFVEILEGLSKGEEYVSSGSFIIKADIGKAEAGHDHAH
jgi:cobalt-zinc-cadmium efflux system membrane fusion protein